MPTTTTTLSGNVQPGQRIGLGGISEIRIEFVKVVSHTDGCAAGRKVLLVGDVFLVGTCGSFQPGFVLKNLDETVEFLGTF